MEEILDIEHTAPRMIYSGFWIRVAASLIDSFVMYIANALVMAGIVFLPLGDSNSLAERMSNPSSLMAMMGLMYTGMIVINWLYYALMESSKNRATLGKMAVGIIVVNEKGERISFTKATGRYFAKILSGIILGIGFIMAAFDQRKQSLHDRLAKTVVINRR
jgi:uncharacterized RDD family membrane protein YckC